MPSGDRIPSLINGEYDKDTEGQWGFHRSDLDFSPFSIVINI